MHNHEESNEKKYFGCVSSKNDANATAWEAVKAIVVNSNAADHSVSRK